MLTGRAIAMTRAWSKQIEQHYRFQMPPDLASWFDDGVWQNPGQSEFRYPLAPEQFIEPPAGTIWAGFMLPDTLPLVGNQYGDWLCVRIAPEGRVAEILCWNHGGGDWVDPVGQICVVSRHRYRTICSGNSGAIIELNLQRSS